MHIKCKYGKMLYVRGRNKKLSHIQASNNEVKGCETFSAFNLMELKMIFYSNLYNLICNLSFEK